MLTEQVQRGIFYAVSCVALLLAVTERNNKLRELDYPRCAYWMVIGALCMSVITVNIYHGQPIVQSIITLLPYLFSYLYLYVLIKFRLSPALVIKILMIASLLAIPVYFCNLLSFPAQMFGIENAEGADFSRGMLRVPIPFFEALLIVFFYAIQQWKASSRAIWMCWIVIGVIMICLSLTRQIILVAFGLALLYAINGLSWAKKIAILAVCMCAGIVVVNKVPIFKAMVELSEMQAELNEDKEDVRVRAWRYYTYENQEGIVTVLLGNGVPSLGITRYGIEFDQNMQETKCYAADVGWAGFFYYFGLIGTVALFVMLAKSAYIAHNRHRDYLLYWLLFIIITAVASGPVVYYYQILIIMTALYLVYAPDEEDGSDHTELQQC